MNNLRCALPPRQLTRLLFTAGWIAAAAVGATAHAVESGDERTAESLRDATPAVRAQTMEKPAPDHATPADEDVGAVPMADPLPGAGTTPDTDPEAAPKATPEAASDGPSDVPTDTVASVPVLPFEILDGRIPPGETLQVSWFASDNFAGIAEPTPVLVAHGTEPGPVLCLTAAVHGDELNGIEMVRQLLYDVNPAGMRGTMVGVPIVNLFGFRQGSRYLPDRRDLNRHFPGSPEGSAASRIAHSLFQKIIRRCDYLVDLHTGSFHRTNLPQLRADLSHEGIAHLTKGFGATAVLNSRAASGTLREAATRFGIPSVTLEAGEPMRFQPDEVEHGVRALRSLLNHLGMVTRFSLWGESQPVYYESHWVRADDGGILTSDVQLGQTVLRDQIIGRVTDPITNRRVNIRSPYNGRILGMALNQAVLPGFAAYHIGIQRREEELTTPESELDTPSDTEEGSDGAPPARSPEDRAKAGDDNSDGDGSGNADAASDDSADPSAEARPG